jgi:hypothetical protein
MACLWRMPCLFGMQTGQPTCSNGHWQCGWRISAAPNVSEVADQHEVLRNRCQQYSSRQDATGPRLATTLHAACRSISGAR